MPNLIVAPRAKTDLKHIGRYTQRKWGIEQRDHYLKKLNERFYRLLENPKMGIHRNDIKKGYYSFPHEKHLIFYQIADNQDVHIIGVVGTGQSLIKYFH